MIMDAVQADKWSHHLLSSGSVIKVEVPAALEKVPQNLLEGFLLNTPAKAAIPAKLYVPAIPATSTTPAIPAKDYASAVPASSVWIIQKSALADLELRKAKLNELRARRQPLLDAADININILLDAGLSMTAMRKYRQKFRDITKPMIKTNGNPKVSVDTLNVASFVFPVKPA